MSLGWQTESTILPKEQQKLTVNNRSGFISLQAIIKDKKPSVTPAIQPKIRKNKGIEERIKKDVQAINPSPNTPTMDSKSIQAALKIKQKMYEKMEEHGSGLQDTMVDFTSKAIMNDDEYQDIRKKFYEEKLTEIRQNVKPESQLMSEQERDRIHWEKKKLDELIHGIHEEKSKVQQSYDKGLSYEEFQALKEVLKQKKEEDQRLDALKRKGKELTEERIRKLRKMNIIKSTQQQ